MRKENEFDVNRSLVMIIFLIVILAQGHAAGYL